MSRVNNDLKSHELEADELQAASDALLVLTSNRHNVLYAPDVDDVLKAMKILDHIRVRLDDRIALDKSVKVGHPYYDR